MSGDDDDKYLDSLDALSSLYNSDWDNRSDSSEEPGQFLDWDDYYGDNGVEGVVNDGIHDYIGMSVRIHVLLQGLQKYPQNLLLKL